MKHIFILAILFSIYGCGSDGGSSQDASPINVIKDEPKVANLVWYSFIQEHTPTVRSLPYGAPAIFSVENTGTAASAGKSVCLTMIPGCSDGYLSLYQFHPFIIPPINPGEKHSFSVMIANDWWATYNESHPYLGAASQKITFSINDVSANGEQLTSCITTFNISLYYQKTFYAN